MRISRDFYGCADEILKVLLKNGGGMLIVGKPACGKTTLLRDIFADHVVQQAYEICKLSSKKISGKYPYFKDAKIGRLPAEIAEKNII